MAEKINKNGPEYRINKEGLSWTSVDPTTIKCYTCRWCSHDRYSNGEFIASGAEYADCKKYPKGKPVMGINFDKCALYEEVDPKKREAYYKKFSEVFEARDKAEYDLKESWDK